ncbi:MAG TPA: 6-phosphogluconolactonase [Solirubrobacteraceae bacterium]|nr:6-phosphogluconolactonase [Solirubrobacteraceae bacterium]
MTPEIVVLEDPASACASILVSALLHGGDVVLTGGSTPGAAYAEAAETIRSQGGELGGTTLWFSDERCVTPDDERSNFGLIKRTLLDPLAELTAPTVRRIRGELGPERGADAYERELRDAGEPEFDLMLLGLGPDGHCASLFPDQPALAERARLAVGVEEAGLEPFVPRVSLTLSALAMAKQTVFLITGKAKADAVAAAFGPDSDPDPDVPASMLVPLTNELRVLLDADAASRL